MVTKIKELTQREQWQSEVSEIQRQIHENSTERIRLDGQYDSAVACGDTVTAVQVKKKLAANGATYEVLMDREAALERQRDDIERMERAAQLPALIRQYDSQLAALGPHIDAARVGFLQAVDTLETVRNRRRSLKAMAEQIRELAASAGKPEPRLSEPPDWRMGSIIDQVGRVKDLCAQD